MKRINDVFDAADARIRKEAASCKGFWDRRTSVTMAGPHYLSVLASDDFFCGGAYPDDSNLALVFDLVTGALVDWGKLLPGLAKKKQTTTAADGTTLGTISSPRLQELYIDGTKPSEDCTSALDLDQLDFIVWLNTKEPGLVVKPILAHVVRACGPAITIPLKILKSTEVSADFLRAFSLPRERRDAGADRRAPRLRN
ncbi:MAG: hypothetical protein C3F11_21355 [Methylocystaceae bacterium]|nr:MAG: hypothetical protein C3F11_21355 [Methylocystaceae bacterium]